jgi:zinc transporter
VGEATNRNLFLLSIMTTSLLPITVITGAFGMNVGGIPWGNHGSGFWWVIGVLLISVVVTLLVLRWRRIL